MVMLVPFVSPGVTVPDNIRVHGGFLSAWNEVATLVNETITSQLELYPDYSIAVSGHSLGASLACLGAVSIKQNFPNNNVRMYTYGQPRTGNSHFAFYVNDVFGADALRSVHTRDGVPTAIPPVEYRHHGIEYWQVVDPAHRMNIRECTPDGEDVLGSGSIPSNGINAPHMVYYNIVVPTPFCSESDKYS